MKQFLLPVMLMGSFCVSILLVGSQNYETNMKTMQDAANTIADFSNETIDTAPYNDALKRMSPVQDAINFEAKNPKIVSKQIKTKLDSSISAVNDILWELSNYENTARKMDIAEAGIKKLAPILKSLKPSLADAFSKTTGDLKKGMYSIVNALIGALKALEIKQNFPNLKHLNKSLKDTSMLAERGLE